MRWFQRFSRKVLAGGRVRNCDDAFSWQRKFVLLITSSPWKRRRLADRDLPRPGSQGHVSPEKADELTSTRNAHPTAVLLDESGNMGRAYDARVTPHMYIIDEDGILRYMGVMGISLALRARRSGLKRSDRPAAPGAHRPRHHKLSSRCRGAARCVDPGTVHRQRCNRCNPGRPC